MQAGVFFRYLAAGSKRAFTDGAHQFVANAAVMGAHTVDMLFKITLFDKPRQRILLEIRHCTGIKREPPFKFLQQVFWQYHVADSDRRGKAFRKGIDVNNAFRAVNSLQGGNRLSGKAEFGIVVIFNNITPFFPRRPAEELVSFSDRRYNPGWKMMVRRNVRHIGCRHF